MEIRSAVADDIPAIVTLGERVWRAHYPGIISAEQIDYMLARGYARGALAPFFASRTAGIDLAFDQGPLAGFMAWLLLADTRELKIDKLYVDMARQRTGVGRALLDRASAHAREHDARCVILNVNKQNTQAIAAYRKHGFAVREGVTIDIGGGFVMDDFVMQRTV
jgi:ribosomal protein S18 acetylase RimI-like enzyme